MVLINETKYACQACIKGHRSSACLHSDRPLYEVAKKGRPMKNCEHCREVRKTKAVKVKCMCSAAAKKEQKEKEQGSGLEEEGEAGPLSGPKKKRREIKLGAPAFPNGLKDVHERTAAADVLSLLSSDGSGAVPGKSTVNDLLNPCDCLTGGKCTCCVARAKPSPSFQPPHAPVHPLSVESSIPITSVYVGSARAIRSQSASSSGGPSRRTSLSGPHSSSYNPYPSPSTHASGSKINIRSSVTPTLSSSTTPESVLRQGLKDLVSNYMKAKHDRVQNALVNFSLSTGATDWVGGDALRATAISEEDKIEEVLMVSTCTCGDDCACPSCVQHGNPPAEGMEGVEHHGCGESCNSCFACSSHVAMPANLSSRAAMQTVADLLAASSSKVPPPPLLSRPYELDPTNLSVLPPSAFLGGDESRAAFGLLEIPKLECCTGKCRCPPGECTCMSDCCGCCDKCLCDEEEDAQARPPQNVPSSQVVSSLGDGAKSSSCCAVKPEIVEIDLSPSPPTTLLSSAPAPKKSSCCAPASPVQVVSAPPPTKKSCCAPAPSTASSTPAAESSRAAPSTNGKGKTKCGSGGCGKAASAAVGLPVKLRRLLPKPSVTGPPSLPSTNPPPGSSLSTIAPAVQESQQAPGSNPVCSPPLDPNSPNFLAHLFGSAVIPAPDALASPYHQPQQPFDPSIPTISDAELDEIMAALATNGGSLEDVLGGFGGGDFSSVPGQVDLEFQASEPSISNGASLDLGQQPLLDGSQAAAVLPADFDVSAFLNAFEPGGLPVDPGAFNFGPPPPEQNLADLDPVLGSTSDLASFEFDLAGQGTADVDWSLLFNPPTPS